jgi:Tfp pilus assembly protein PilX
MNSFRVNNHDGPERGMALGIAILVLLVITTVVAVMISMSSTETAISGNFRDEQAAFFGGRGGLEEARDRLRSSSTGPLTANLTTMGNALPGAANGVLYITNAQAGETVTPWNTAAETTPRHYPDDEICKELGCVGAPAGSWYISTTANNAYATTPPLPWKWVRIMAKLNRSVTATGSLVTSVNGAQDGLRVCWNGTGNEVTIPNTFASCTAFNANYRPVYELTALAETAGGSRRMTQYEVTPASFPPIPGPMIFDGPNPTYGAPNSNAFNVSGVDAAQGPNAGTGCGAPANMPAIGAFSNADQTSLTNNGTVQKRSGSYASAAPYATTPAIANVSASLGSNPKVNLTTVDGLTNLVNMITAAAGSNVFPPGSPSNLGTTAAPAINVVNGDYTAGNGTGILLVTGTLTMSGNPSWNGLILVIGKGNVTKNGGGNGTLNGSLFVANMYTDTNYTTQIALGANNPPGPPTINWNGGGNATLQYDSCWINLVTGGAFPLTLVSMRELIY